jgi:hypothetical protein
VAVVDETFVRAMSPDQEPLGRQVTVTGRFLSRTPYRIVGIVANTRFFSHTTEPSPQIYLSFDQNPLSRLWLIVRTTPGAHGELPALIRREVAQVDPTQIVEQIAPFDDLLSASLAPWRFVTWLMTAFALVAIGLAAVGLAAVMAAAVTQRTREIGVRMALGAPRSSVVRLVLGHTLVVASAGTAAGLLLAIWTTPFLSKSLYEVTARDPWMFMSSALFMLAIALLASYIPARRATTIDPIVALRCE